MSEFSKGILEVLKTSYIADPKFYEEYRKKIVKKMKKNNVMTVDLFDNFEKEDFSEILQVKKSFIKFATNDYVDKGFGFEDKLDDISFIVPRIEKAKEEQSKRSKDKAEVFTPSWVCNNMNNIVDNEEVYVNAFNIEKEDKTWVATSSPIKFNNGKNWLDYVKSKRIEISCGEAPYLVSLYDTVSGAPIPVRDNDGNFGRIGLLDRKFRVVSENSSKKDWLKNSKIALLNTYGYEWQGDNLILARKNILQSFVDYYMDFFKKEPEENILLEVAEIVSWNVWQMDGLKSVIPETCTSDCRACKKKKFAGHNGIVPVLRSFENDGSFKIYPFEELLSVDHWVF